MPTTWICARGKQPDANIEVVLSFDDDSPENGTQRHLIAEVMGQRAPCGRDWFATLDEAKQRCLKDLGIEDQDWEVLSEPPRLLEGIEQGAEAAIRSYLTAISHQPPPVAQEGGTKGGTTGDGSH